MRIDFAAKLAIADKEARETRYWIRLRHATGYFDKEESESLLSDAQEILRVIGKIRVTLRKKS